MELRGAIYLVMWFNWRTHAEPLKPERCPAQGPDPLLHPLLYFIPRRELVSTFPRLEASGYKLVRGETQVFVSNMKVRRHLGGKKALHPQLKCSCTHNDTLTMYSLKKWLCFKECFKFGSWPYKALKAPMTYSWRLYNSKVNFRIKLLLIVAKLQKCRSRYVGHQHCVLFQMGRVVSRCVYRCKSQHFSIMVKLWPSSNRFWAI